MRAQNIFFHASEAQGESPVTNDSRVKENGKQHFVSWKPLEERESFFFFSGIADLGNSRKLSLERKLGKGR